MTPAEVARALVARSWWEGRAGMLVASRGEAGALRLVSVHADMDGRPNAVGLGKLPDDRTGTYWTEAGDVPDLTDAATAGVLLEMLREQCEVISCGHEDGVWFAGDGHYTHVKVHECGSTLGEAVARALLAVRP